jgi:putative colanic acid biosynthesis UDP-glucose lipid carrier transferase
MALATDPTVNKASLLRRAFHMNAPRDRLIDFLESFIDPVALIGSLWCLAFIVDGKISLPYFILGFFVFSLSYPSPAYLQSPITFLLRGILSSWATIGGLLAFFGYAVHLINHFDQGVLILWLWIAPVSMLSIHILLRFSAPWVVSLQGGIRKIIVAGMNEQGLALAMQIANNPLSGMQVVGFFDDRDIERLKTLEHFNKFKILGGLAEMHNYVKSSNIDSIYLSLPMTTQQRIMHLLDELRDTTASIYFIPDLFVTSLIQGHVGAVGEIPVVAVCESPFTGINGIIKRLSDILLSILILTLISPALLILTIAIKLSSPGPVLFKQRRYGLDGREITVYKFRSMRVLEDGNVINQAQKNDPRITPLGAFMRKNSLDELPQFFNVLQGSMSIVGPRPHAVAHNEIYRKLIKGYMSRHKVKPGITGWAQVNGLRGETKTLDRMKVRIDYDLDYLRNWSLHLDMYIILKTILVVFRDQNAH